MIRNISLHNLYQSLHTLAPIDRHVRLGRIYSWSTRALTTIPCHVGTTLVPPRYRFIYPQLSRPLVCPAGRRNAGTRRGTVGCGTPRQTHGQGVDAMWRASPRVPRHVRISPRIVRTDECAPYCPPAKIAQGINVSEVDPGIEGEGGAAFR